MRQLQISPLDGYEPEIGPWLWALQDVRRRYTLRLIKDLDARLVDWEGPDGQENAIGPFCITSPWSRWAGYTET